MLFYIGGLNKKLLVSFLQIEVIYIDFRGSLGYGKKPPGLCASHK